MFVSRITILRSAGLLTDRLCAGKIIYVSRVFAEKRACTKACVETVQVDDTHDL